MARERLTGVLLVGGASRRFGSPKALAPLAGETLSERGWRILGETCDERVAVGKRADGIVLPFPLVDDATEVRAPLAGVVAGLRAARHDLCVFLPVDAAAMTADDLRALVGACAGDAAVPPTGPLPGAYRRRALGVLERRLARGELRLRDALEHLDVAVVELDPWQLANVNTPADLQAAERRARALAAARAVADAHGLDASAARILQDWNDTIVHLAPAPVVARVATSTIRDAGAETVEAVFGRELAVAAYVAGRGGPVVAPTGELPPGPHRSDGLVLSFWELADVEGREASAREAAEALRALHGALDGYPAPLPALTDRLDRAQAVAAELPRLPEDDRAFLARALRELRARLAGFGYPKRPIHGGAHTANLLRTPAGLRWIDFDTVCLGPLEWDLAHLPEEAATAFPDRDDELLSLLRRLVGAEVAVWCWRAYGRAGEVDEAARFHLRRLRETVG